MTAPSVLTIVRNREGHLRQLVEGLRRSTLPPRDLTIVDMGDTPVAAPAADFPITIVRLPGDRLPLAAARNLAARTAAGDALVFLDVDCIPMRGCLATLASALDGAPDALLCADVRYLGPDDARGDWTEDALIAAGAPHPIRDFPKSGLRREANPGLFWSLAFAIRRTRFDALGGFDERFCGYGAEDTDFGFRADAAGMPLLFVGGAIACHQHHPVSDPPVEHFDDIVRNARVFHGIWGWWPMEGWLDAFAARGLIARSADTLSVLRRP